MQTLKERIQRGRELVAQHEHLDLTAGELTDLARECVEKRTGDAIFDLVAGAYWAGLATGEKYGREQSGKEG